MSDAAIAPQTAPQNAAGRQAGNAGNRVVELRVSGNLMRLETGLYCIVNKPAPNADLRSGMPGVRLSPAPGGDSRPEQVEITSFRDDGWLSGFGDAALVRVHQGPAHVLVTVYQDPAHPEQAPNIQVVKLLDRAPPRAGAARVAPQAAAAPAQGAAHVAAAPAAAAPPAGPQVMDMVAHIQGLGDVGAVIDERLGEVGSKRWIEGFAIAPTREVAPSDIEYQAVLGRGWLSPWVEGGEFCGSRGMALPVLGLRLRLRGDAARDWECTYSASFTDGTQAGPVAAGAACESESLSPLESFQIHLRRRGQAPAPAAPAAPARTAPAAAAPPLSGTSGTARVAMPRSLIRPGPQARGREAMGTPAWGSPGARP
jgi:hypothetical protein